MIIIFGLVGLVLIVDLVCLFFAWRDKNKRRQRDSKASPSSNVDVEHGINTQTNRDTELVALQLRDIREESSRIVDEERLSTCSTLRNIGSVTVL